MFWIIFELCFKLCFELFLNCVLNCVLNYFWTVFWIIFELCFELCFGLFFNCVLNYFWIVFWIVCFELYVLNCVLNCVLNWFILECLKRALSNYSLCHKLWSCNSLSNAVYLRYFKLWILLNLSIQVWNIKDLHHQVIQI